MSRVEPDRVLGAAPDAWCRQLERGARLERRGSTHDDRALGGGHRGPQRRLGRRQDDALLRCARGESRVAERTTSQTKR